jgi:hypothetical protein
MRSYKELHPNAKEDETVRLSGIAGVRKRFGA